MSTVGATSSSSSSQASTPRSSIGGVGVGATTDTSAASINKIRSNALDAFRKSAQRFSGVVSDVVSLQDRIDSMKDIVKDLSELVESAKSPGLTESDRLRLNNEFARGLRKFEGIIKDSSEAGINIGEADSLTKTLRTAGIEFSTPLETPGILRNAVIGSSTNTASSSLYSQRIDTLENVETAEMVLERAKNILDKDAKLVSNTLDSIDKAYELSAAAYNSLLDMDSSGVSNFDQLALKIRSAVRGKTSDFLIRANSGIDRDLVDSILRR